MEKHEYSPNYESDGDALKLDGGKSVVNDVDGIQELLNQQLVTEAMPHRTVGAIEKQVSADSNPDEMEPARCPDSQIQTEDSKIRIL